MLSMGSWRAQRGNRTVLQIWRMAPLCVMWCLWRQRNAQSFEDHELGIIELKKRVLPNTFFMESFMAFLASFNACELSRFFSVFFKLKACICGLFCILPVYIGCAPCAFNILNLYRSKKKKAMVGEHLSSFCIDIKNVAPEKYPTFL